MNETTIAEKLNSFWKETQSEHRKWRDRAAENQRFYVGDQWASADREKLKSEEKPCLSINNILPVINTLSGFERQNRRMSNVYPKKGGTRKIAEILTAIFGHISDNSNLPYEKSAVFLDGIITGKGWLQLGVSYEDDPIDGDINMERISPFDIYEDPKATTYDLNKTGTYIIRAFWWDKDTLHMAYPHKKDALTDIFDELEKSVDTSRVISYGDNESDIAPYPTPELKKYKYRVRETFWRQYQRRKFTVNTKTLSLAMISPGTDNVLMKKIIGKSGDVKIIERIVPVLYQTIAVGNTILEHIEDPFNGVMTFPFFRFAPYWLDGHVMGVVDNIKDPQREVNKRASQAIHHLNQSANTGWLGPAGWEGEDKEEVEAFGSKPGVSIHYVQGKKPERLKPVPISQGHLLLSKIAADNIKIISSVNADLLGLDKTASESGVAMRERKRQGLIGNEIIFDNFDYTNQIFGETLLEFVRKTNVISNEEIQEIAAEEKMDITAEIETIRNSWKLGKYGVKIVQSALSPTDRFARFQLLIEAARNGVPIPMDIIIENSDLPNREEILERLKVQQQQETQAAAQGQPPPGQAGPAQPRNPAAKPQSGAGRGQR